MKWAICRNEEKKEEQTPNVVEPVERNAVKEVKEEPIVSKEQPKEEPTTDAPHTLKGPKILGKIDLDANKKVPKQNNNAPSLQ